MAYIKLEDLQKYPIRIDHYDKVNGNRDFVLGCESVIEYAENLPTADVAEVKHGYWKDRYGNKYYNHLYECSVCGKEALYECYKNELDQWKERQALTPACPYCFAIMDGSKAE